MKVIDLPQIADQKVTVKAHERVEVDHHRGQPRCAGEHEGCGAGRAVGQQRPGQQCDAGQEHFRQHAACADQQAGTSIIDAPGIADVGIEQRQKDHERHAHALHSTASALGHECVAELMTELGEKQRHAERQRAAEAEQVREGADKALPVAGHRAPA